MRKVSKIPAINDNPTRAELLALLKEARENPEECIVVPPEELDAEATKSEKIA